MAEELLKIENLSKSFATGSSWALKRSPVLHAVENISFTVRRGETFGVVGESGCGKTTLGKCIVRLHAPETGKMICCTPEGEQKDLLSLNKKDSFAMRRNIQMIFQDPYASLNPMRNILDAFDEPLRIHGLGNKEQRRELVAQMMKKVNLQPDYMYRYPHEFSGGQRQRICIVKALAMKPELIVCDEPVSALDVSIQAQILNLMKELQAELGLAYLFIAHDLSVVQYMSNRIAVMYLGQIVELADSEELYHNRLHPYTRALLDTVPVPVVSPEGQKLADKAVLHGDVPSPLDPPKGCRFHPRCAMCTPKCKEQAPELRNVGNGHMVACHLVDSCK